MITSLVRIHIDAGEIKGNGLGFVIDQNNSHSIIATCKHNMQMLSGYLSCYAIYKLPFKSIVLQHRLEVINVFMSKNPKEDLAFVLAKKSILLTTKTMQSHSTIQEIKAYHLFNNKLQSHVGHTTHTRWNAETNLSPSKSMFSVSVHGMYQQLNLAGKKGMSGGPVEDDRGILGMIIAQGKDNKTLMLPISHIYAQYKEHIKPLLRKT